MSLMLSAGEKLGQCLKCGSPVADGINFCNVCGMPVTPQTASNQVDESTDTKATILVGLAFVVLFFASGMAMAAAMAEPGFWIIAIILTAAGLLMLLARYLILRNYRKRIERIEAEAMVECKYCGGKNNRKIGRCVFCGAPLRLQKG